MMRQIQFIMVGLAAVALLAWTAEAAADAGTGVHPTLVTGQAKFEVPGFPLRYTSPRQPWANESGWQIAIPTLVADADGVVRRDGKPVEVADQSDARGWIVVHESGVAQLYRRTKPDTYRLHRVADQVGPLGQLEWEGDQLQAVQTLGGGVVNLEWQDGRLASIVDGNGWLRFGYDDAGRLATAQDAESGAATKLSYDVAGLLTRMAERNSRREPLTETHFRYQQPSTDGRYFGLVEVLHPEQPTYERYQFYTGDPLREIGVPGVFGSASTHDHRNLAGRLLSVQVGSSPKKFHTESWTLWSPGSDADTDSDAHAQLSQVAVKHDDAWSLVDFSTLDLPLPPVPQVEVKVPEDLSTNCDETEGFPAADLAHELEAAQRTLADDAARQAELDTLREEINERRREHELALWVLLNQPPPNRPPIPFEIVGRYGIERRLIIRPSGNWHIERLFHHGEGGDAYTEFHAINRGTRERRIGELPGRWWEGRDTQDLSTVYHQNLTATQVKMSQDAVELATTWLGFAIPVPSGAKPVPLRSAGRKPSKLTRMKSRAQKTKTSRNPVPRGTPSAARANAKRVVKEQQAVAAAQSKIPADKADEVAGRIESLDRQSVAKSDVIMDTNGAIVLEKQASGTISQDGQRKLAAELNKRAKNGRLRITDWTAAESWKGDLLPRDGVKLTVSRQSPEYKAVLEELSLAGVGEAVDQRVVADALFAEAEAVPTFITLDRGVQNGLYRIALNKDVVHMTDDVLLNGFDVSVHGRTLHVQVVR